MFPARDQLQPLRPGGEGVAVSSVAFKQRKVEFAELKFTLVGRAPSAPHVKPQRWPRAHEVGEQLRHTVGREILRNAEPYDAFSHRPGYDVTRFLFERENPSRIGQEPFALLGERRRFAVPLQERSPEHVLEPFDLLADGRLGAMDPLAGPGEPAGINHRHETSKKINIHHRLRTIYKATFSHSII